MCLWKTPKISTPSLTARDLVPSTESKEPNSPKLGGADDWSSKRRGAQALQIKKNTPVNSGGTSINNNYQNGGWTI